MAAAGGLTAGRMAAGSRRGRGHRVCGTGTGHCRAHAVRLACAGGRGGFTGRSCLRRGNAKIDSYIRQLQNLKKQTESKLYGVIYEAYDEYISHPVEERNLGMKVSIVVSKTAKLTSVQGECDKEFNAILKELRQYLRDNGRDQSVADQAEQEYKKMKSDLTSELTGIVYNSAVGSGDGGKWIQEHIEHKR